MSLEVVVSAGASLQQFELGAEGLVLAISNQQGEDWRAIDLSLAGDEETLLEVREQGRGVALRVLVRAMRTPPDVLRALDEVVGSEVALELPAQLELGGCGWSSSTPPACLGCVRGS